MKNLLLYSNKYDFYFKSSYNLPKCGSYIVLAHYWFEYKLPKIQYFIGRCFKARKKGFLSSIIVRTFCYKTMLEILVFIKSPLIVFLYSFIRNNLYKRMSFLFLRKIL